MKTAEHEPEPFQAEAPAESHTMARANSRSHRESAIGFRFSLFRLLSIVGFIALAAGYAVTLNRLRVAEAELGKLRAETGYLAPSEPGEIAAVRLVEESPKSYRFRLRVPDTGRYRVVYSTYWPSGNNRPQWFGAVSVPAGESVIVVRIIKDPRDERWKITTLRRHADGTRRMATVLPDDQIALFRRPHDSISSGIGKQSTAAPIGQTIRLLDERMIRGEGALMLYGDKPPDEDLVGVFAELQPDEGPI